MARDTLSVRFDGDLTLDTLARAFQRYQALVAALSGDVSKGATINWIVEDLAAGSAVATVRGRSEEPAAVERVTIAYNIVTRALEQRRPVEGYSRGVARAAADLVGMINGRVRAIVFEADGERAVVTGTSRLEDQVLVDAYGGIEGRVSALSDRHGLSFTLYDTLFDHAVRCYLAPGYEERMRDVWGNHALVVGMVRRDPITGQPREIRSVVSIEKLTPVAPGSYRDARGILPYDPHEPSPEDRIRQLRDA